MLWVRTEAKIHLTAFIFETKCIQFDYLKGYSFLCGETTSVTVAKITTQSTFGFNCTGYQPPSDNSLYLEFNSSLGI